MILKCKRKDTKFFIYTRSVMLNNVKYNLLGYKIKQPLSKKAVA